VGVPRRGHRLPPVQFFAARSLWLDESMLALNIASRPLGELLRPLDYNQVAPPLFLWLSRLSIRLAGTNEMALRAYRLALKADPASVPALAGVARSRRPGRDRPGRSLADAGRLRQRGQALRQRRLRHRRRARGHARGA
jgi:hypothetical protein